MALTGTVTVDWADGTTEALTGNSGTHKFTENGYYRVQARDEAGNYGYVDIDVVIEPTGISLPKTFNADEVFTDVGDPHFRVPVKGTHLDPTHVQFAVVDPHHVGLVPEALWHFVSEPLDPANAAKEALLRIPVKDLAARKDIQVLFRYYVSNGFPYVTWYELPNGYPITALSKSGQFGADFSDEFNK